MRGKLNPDTYEPTGGRDHPRRCGENSKKVFCLWVKRGSPPQVRGKLTKKFKYSEEIGITPAGAGKTNASTATGKAA